MTKDVAKIFLDPFIKACNDVGARFYVLQGTCLGVVRGEGFVKTDPDIDVGVFEEDWTDEILEKILESGELIIHRARKIGWQEWMFNKIDRNKDGCYSIIDIVPNGRKNDTARTPYPCMDIHIPMKGVDSYHWFSGYQNIMHRIPSQFFEGDFKEEVLEDWKVKILPKAEEYLEWWYGEDWRTPMTKDQYVGKAVMKRYNIWTVKE